MEENFYEELLDIKTEEEQIGFNKSYHYHRYEPTPYDALEVLFNQYRLTPTDRIVDYGCGKGRLNFFINYLFNSTVIGIEMNDVFYKDAIENKKSYLKKHKKDDDNVYFHCCLAEDYQINPFDNRFYFFNPFSIQIFMNIVNSILISAEKSPREIDIILYYISDDYIYFLENQTSFELKKEIKLPIYKQNSNERFLIYSISYV